MKNLRLKISALLFGIAIWFYAISLQDFQYTLEVPLVFSKIPEVLAIASKPPRTISIQVSGNVVDLIRMRSKGTKSAAIVVDAQHVEQGWSHFQITQDNFVSADFPEVKYIEGDHIRSVDVEFDTKIRRKVPVKLMAEFEEAKGFTFVSDPVVEPSEILFSGARTALIPLENVQTSTELFKNISTDGVYELALNLENIPAYISTEDSSVKVKISVQPISTTTFNDIPVHLIGMYDKQKYSLEPSIAEVQITGGKEILQSIDPDELDIFIEFNRFAIENTDVMSPSFRLGKNVKGIQVHPDKFKLVEKNIQKKDSVITTVPAPEDSIKTEIKEKVETTTQESETVQTSKKEKKAKKMKAKAKPQAKPAEQTSEAAE